MTDDTLPHPPTLLVVHRKEKRSKCTVEPLRGQAGFEFVWYPLNHRPNVEGYVRLGMDGPLISSSDAGCGLLVLDATWRLAEKMEQDFAEVPVRSLPPFETAYPRVSKLSEDPTGGLATIEAVYAAYHLLGRTTQGLLDAYYWRAEFLERNPSLGS